MSFFEINKIFAAILLAVILFVAIGFVSNFIINIEQKEQVNAYKIEIPENDSTELATNIIDSADIEPISDLLKTASFEKGEKVFKKCATCHSYDKNGSSKVGPNLWDIINKSKASIEGYSYSDALNEFGGAWNYEELALFLYKPKDYIPGTKMNFAGLKKVQDRANVIFWLREQSDNPADLPN